MARRGAPMILRFSLYGFLKNLRLFEAFLVLALRDRGLDYLEIGLLIAVREVVTNVLEVPSGALADAWGRRRCMVASFVAYVVAYLLLGLASNTLVLALGMGAYGFGQAFRSGTHKALIHAWLRREGRMDERTEVYGYTRSWSKRGSAWSSLVGGGLLLAGADYRWVFVGSALPALLNVVNLATYPADLDGPRREANVRGAYAHLASAVRSVRGPGRLRGLVLASVGVEGTYKAVEGYVQPALAALALALPVATDLGETQRVGVVAGGVSFVLYLLASAASRRAHRFEKARGGADGAAAALVLLAGVVYGVLALGAGTGAAWLVVVAFVGLAVLQNLWRPIHVGRFDAHTRAESEATVLSLESQARTATAAVLAPAIGAAVDVLAGPTVDVGSTPIRALWPVPVVALVVLRIATAADRRAVRGADAGAGR